MAKKENIKIGDYTVILSRDVECWFCGETFKKGTKQIRMYGANGKTWWHFNSEECSEMKILFNEKLD